MFVALFYVWNCFYIALVIKANTRLSYLIFLPVLHLWLIHSWLPSAITFSAWKFAYIYIHPQWFIFPIAQVFDYRENRFSLSLSLVISYFSRFSETKLKRNMGKFHVFYMRFLIMFAPTWKVLYYVNFLSLLFGMHVVCALVALGPIYTCAINGTAEDM